MNLSRTARKLSWVTSHPGYKAHPSAFPLRALRWEWHRLCRTPVLLPLCDFRIEARPSDGIGRLICYFREQADELFAFMKHYLKTGMTFIDVGANIGAHTIHGARLVGDEGTVISFEADPNTFRLLERNVNLNHIANATLYNRCISNKRELLTFHVSTNTARSSLFRKGSSQLQLLACTLDEMLPRRQQIDLLKIDVEGADYLVLAGARSIFEERPPKVVVVEVSSCSGEIQEFLLSRDYRLYRFDGNKSVLERVESVVFNTYAVHKRVPHESLPSALLLGTRET
jgi:FkbM family methyltransferase